MNTEQVYTNKFLTVMHAARVIIRWYILFSAKTALVFIIAKLSQSIMEIVIINSGIAAATGFVFTGISGTTAFIIEKRKLSAFIASIFESIVYLLIFFLSFFILKLLKGFSL